MQGKTVAHYRIADQLGSGGMGVVYRAEDLRLGRSVALKFLPPQLSRDSAAVERFQREARTASSLNHPNICTIYAIDEVEGQRFIAMELLDGQPLSSAIAGRALPIDRVLDLGIQISDALDAAHSQGILHRDIKPANIFITKRGQAKVLDFGLAKLAAAPLGFNDSAADSPTVAGLLLTTQGVALGTVAYMSPEQARGEPLDARSDLFSFGIVLYEMCTGQQAFPGQTSAVVFDSILNRMPAPLAALRADVPPQLDQIICKALEKDRSMRYQTASDLHADLKRLKRDRDSGRLLASGATPVVAPSGSQPVAAVPASQPAISASQPAAPAGSSPSAPLSAAAPAVPISAAPSAPAVPISAAPSAPAVAAADVAPAAPAAPPGPAPAKAAAPRKSPSWPTMTTGRMLAAGAALVLVVGAVAAVALVSRSSPADPPPAAAAIEPAPAVDPAAVEEPADEAVAVTDPDEGLVLETEEAQPSVRQTASNVAAGEAATAGGRRAAAERTPRQPAPLAAERAAPTGGEGAQAAVSSSVAVDPGAMLLSVARAKAEASLFDQAAADLETLVRTHPSSASAPPALLSLANIRMQQSRPEDAMAVYVELRSRYRSSAAAPEAGVRYAELVLRSSRGNRVEEARDTLAAVARDYADSAWAPRALSMKADLENREKIREVDAAAGGQVSAALVTWRDLAERYPQAAESQGALWNLANAYEDLRRYDFAAQTFVVLATRFPQTRHDAWWKAAELYDKRLRDREAAQRAYSRVPPSSRNYREAQKRLK